MSFSFSFKIQTIEKPQKTRIINFSRGFPLFLSFGIHNCTWILNKTLKGIHWKRTCWKTYIYIIKPKTNEIATFWPPRLNIKTIWFVVLYENNRCSSNFKKRKVRKKRLQKERKTCLLSFLSHFLRTIFSF